MQKIVHRYLRLKPFTLTALVAPLLLALAASGCGYSTPKLVRQDVQTVYVPVFDNETFRAGQEKPLTVAVQEEIRRNSQLSLAPREEADTVLDGTITEVDEYVVTKTIDDNIVNKRIGMTVQIEWTDRRTERPIVSSRKVRVTDRFSPGLGEDKFTGLHEETAQQIIENLWADW